MAGKRDSAMRGRALSNLPHYITVKAAAEQVQAAREAQAEMDATALDARGTDKRVTHLSGSTLLEDLLGARWALLQNFASLRNAFESWGRGGGQGGRGDRPESPQFPACRRCLHRTFASMGHVTTPVVADAVCLLNISPSTPSGRTRACAQRFWRIQTPGEESSR